MKSPNGRITVLKRNYHEVRMGSPLFGQLEIVGSTLGILPGEFAEPMVFSPDSRFLAAAKLVATTPGPVGQVVVLDLEASLSFTVHTFSGLVRSFAWEPDGILSATIWSQPDGEVTHRIWAAPPPEPQKLSWIKRLFR